MPQMVNGSSALGVGGWIRRRSGVLGAVSLAMVIAGPVAVYVCGLALALSPDGFGPQFSAEGAWFLLGASGVLLVSGACVATAVLRAGSGGRTASVIALCFAVVIAVGALALAFYLTVGWEN
jgi:hypothetical protein